MPGIHIAQHVTLFIVVTAHAVEDFGQCANCIYDEWAFVEHDGLGLLRGARIGNFGSGG